MFCYVPIQVSQDGFMLRLKFVFLDFDLLIQLLLKSSSLLNSEGFHHVPIHIMKYKTCNILCLNK